MQQQYSMGLNNQYVAGTGVHLEMGMMPAAPPPPCIQPPDPEKMVPVSPEEIVEKMRSRFYTSIYYYVTTFFFFLIQFTRDARSKTFFQQSNEFFFCSGSQV